MDELLRIVCTKAAENERILEPKTRLKQS
jgi:hypothetical protein